MRLLVVDDEPIVVDTLVHFLEKTGHQAIGADTADEALWTLEEIDVDLVLCDLCMPGFDGLAFLEKVRERIDAPRIIVMTGYANVQRAVETLRAGAYDYFLKPIKLEALGNRLTHVEREIALEREIATLRAGEGGACATSLSRADLLAMFETLGGSLEALGTARESLLGEVLPRERAPRTAAILLGEIERLRELRHALSRLLAETPVAFAPSAVLSVGEGARPARVPPGRQKKNRIAAH